MSDPLRPEEARAPRPIDRLDPRTRVLAALAGVGVAVVLTDLRVLAAALALAIVAVLFAGATARDLGRRLMHVEGFLAVLVVLLPFTMPGETVFTVAGFAATRPGLQRALLVLLRVDLAAVLVFGLIAGLEPVALGHALARLGVPERLVHVFLFAVRFVDLLRGEAGRLRDALRARAFRPNASAHALRTWGDFAGMLMVRAFERAERVDEAMRCRAFGGRLLLVESGRFGRFDGIFAVTFAGLLLLSLMVGRPA